jgi:hypothetical protein
MESYEVEVEGTVYPGLRPFSRRRMRALLT